MSTWDGLGGTGAWSRVLLVLCLAVLTAHAQDDDFLLAFTPPAPPVYGQLVPYTGNYRSRILCAIRNALPETYLETTTHFAVPVGREAGRVYIEAFNTTDGDMEQSWRIDEELRVEFYFTHIPPDSKDPPVYFETYDLDTTEWNVEGYGAVSVVTSYRDKFELHPIVINRGGRNRINDTNFITFEVFNNRSLFQAFFIPDASGRYELNMAVTDACNMTSLQVMSITIGCTHQPIVDIVAPNDGVYLWDALKFSANTDWDFPYGWYDPVRLDARGTFNKVRDNHYFIAYDIMCFRERSDPFFNEARDCTIPTGNGTKMAFDIKEDAPTWAHPDMQPDGLVYRWKVHRAPSGSKFASGVRLRQYYDQVMDPATGHLLIHGVAGELAPPPQIGEGTTPTPTFLPDAMGEFRLQLSVSNFCEVVTKTVTLDYRCNEPPEHDIVITTEPSGTCVRKQLLSAVFSSDPAGEPLYWSWDMSNRPIASEGVKLSHEEGPTTSFQPDFRGDYLVESRIHDGCLEPLLPVVVPVVWSEGCIAKEFNGNMLVAFLVAFTLAVFAYALYKVRNEPVDPNDPRSVLQDVENLQRMEFDLINLMVQQHHQAEASREQEEELMRKLEAGKAFSAGLRSEVSEQSIQEEEEQRERELERARAKLLETGLVDRLERQRSAGENFPHVIKRWRMLQRCVAPMEWASLIGLTLTPNSPWPGYLSAWAQSLGMAYQPPQMYNFFWAAVITTASVAAPLAYDAYVHYFERRDQRLAKEARMAEQAARIQKRGSKAKKRWVRAGEGGKGKEAVALAAMSLEDRFWELVAAGQRWVALKVRHRPNGEIFLDFVEKYVRPQWLRFSVWSGQYLRRWSRLWGLLLLEALYVPFTRAGLDMVACTYRDEKTSLPHIHRDVAFECWKGKHNDYAAASVLLLCTLPVLAVTNVLSKECTLDHTLREIPPLAVARKACLFLMTCATSIAGTAELTRVHPRGEYGIPSLAMGYDPTVHWQRDRVHLGGMTCLCLFMFLVTYWLMPMRGRGAEMNTVRGMAFGSCALMAAAATIVGTGMDTETTAAAGQAVFPMFGMSMMMTMGITYLIMRFMQWRKKDYNLPPVEPCDMTDDVEPRVRGQAVMGLLDDTEMCQRVWDMSVAEESGFGQSALLESVDDSTLHSELPAWLIVLLLICAGKPKGATTAIAVHALNFVSLVVQSREGLRKLQRTAAALLVKRFLHPSQNASVVLAACQVIGEMASKGGLGLSMLLSPDADIIERMKEASLRDHQVYYNRITSERGAFKGGARWLVQFASGLLPYHPQRWIEGELDTVDLIILNLEHESEGNKTAALRCIYKMLWGLRDSLPFFPDGGGTELYEVCGPDALARFPTRVKTKSLNDMGEKEFTPVLTSEIIHKQEIPGGNPVWELCWGKTYDEDSEHAGPPMALLLGGDQGKRVLIAIIRCCCDERSSVRSVAHELVLQILQADVAATSVVTLCGILADEATEWTMETRILEYFAKVLRAWSYNNATVNTGEVGEEDIDFEQRLIDIAEQRAAEAAAKEVGAEYEPEEDGRDPDEYRIQLTDKVMEALTTDETLTCVTDAMNGDKHVEARFAAVQALAAMWRATTCRGNNDPVAELERFYGVGALHALRDTISNLKVDREVRLVTVELVTRMLERDPAAQTKYVDAMSLEMENLARELKERKARVRGDIQTRAERREAMDALRRHRRHIKLNWEEFKPEEEEEDEDLIAQYEEVRKPDWLMGLTSAAQNATDLAYELLEKEQSEEEGEEEEGKQGEPGVEVKAMTWKEYKEKFQPPSGQKVSLGGFMDDDPVLTEGGGGLPPEEEEEYRPAEEEEQRLRGASRSRRARPASAPPEKDAAAQSWQYKTKKYIAAGGGKWKLAHVGLRRGPHERSPFPVPLMRPASADLPPDDPSEAGDEEPPEPAGPPLLDHVHYAPNDPRTAPLARPQSAAMYRSGGSGEMQRPSSAAGPAARPSSAKVPARPHSADQGAQYQPHTAARPASARPRAPALPTRIAEEDEDIPEGPPGGLMDPFRSESNIPGWKVTDSTAHILRPSSAHPPAPGQTLGPYVAGPQAAGLGPDPSGWSIAAATVGYGLAQGGSGARPSSAYGRPQQHYDRPFSAEPGPAELDFRSPEEVEWRRHVAPQGPPSLRPASASHARRKARPTSAQVAKAEFYEGALKPPKAAFKGRPDSAGGGRPASAKPYAPPPTDHIPRVYLEDLRKSQRIASTKQKTKEHADRRRTQGQDSLLG